MPNLEIKLPSLHPLQKKIFEHPARFRVVSAGRRGGKTRLGVVLALVLGLSGKRVWWVAPTYQVSAIAWRLFRMLARPIPGLVVRESERCVLLPTGGSVWFKSSDAPDNLRGEGLDFLIMDEAAYQDETVWEQVLRPALADRKGGALFVSTPAEERGWFRAIWERGQQGGPEWKSWTFPSAANPYLDPMELEAARREMPEIVYRREFLAEFVSASGARVRREWLQYRQPPSGLSIVMGVDLAISVKASADWTACVVMGREADGSLYVLDAQRTRAPFHQVLGFVQQMAAKWSPRMVAVETVQFQAAVVQELLRKTSLPVRGVRPDKDKVTRFQPLEARYEQRLIYHAPGLPGAFEDELLSFPIGQHDDQVDSLAYAYRALDMLRAGGPVVRSYSFSGIS